MNESTQECHHDDVFNGVCVWCRADVGTAPTDNQARIVGNLLGINLVRTESAQQARAERAQMLADIDAADEDD